MGFRFRKSVKIMPGVKVNFGKKGASLSVGRPGATVNVNKKGVRSTIGLPGTGLSHSGYTRHSNRQRRIQRPATKQRKRSIILFSIILALMILFSFIKR